MASFGKMHHGHFVRDSLLYAGGCCFLVHAALDPAFQCDFVADIQVSCLHGQLAPGDHREVVCPTVMAGNGQHQVADAAAKRGAAEDRRLAKGAGQKDLVTGLLSSRLDLQSQNGQDQFVSDAAAVVEGTKLPL